MQKKSWWESLILLIVLALMRIMQDFAIKSVNRVFLELDLLAGKTILKTGCLVEWEQQRVEQFVLKLSSIRFGKLESWP